MMSRYLSRSPGTQATGLRLSRTRLDRVLVLIFSFIGFLEKHYRETKVENNTAEQKEKVVRNSPATSNNTVVSNGTLLTPKKNLLRYLTFSFRFFPSPERVQEPTAKYQLFHSATPELSVGIATPRLVCRR